MCTNVIRPPLWEDCLQKHNGEQQHFEMKVVDRCRNDPTKRQILEALRIQKVPKECVMNGKSEYGIQRESHVFGLRKRIDVTEGPKYNVRRHCSVIDVNYLT